MILQPRDEGLLRHLARYGVLSTHQVSALAFPGISHSTIMRRLRTLECQSFIARVMGLDGGLQAWRLGVRGAPAIGAEPPFRYGNRNATQHEVMLSDVRMRLEELNFAADWISELEMKRRLGRQNHRSLSAERVIPDGLFVASREGIPTAIAVELELHPKARARYDKLFAQYARKSAIGLIWYIVASEAIGKLVLNSWVKVPGYLKTAASPALGYTLLVDLLNNPKAMLLHLAGAKPIRFCDAFSPSGAVSNFERETCVETRKGGPPPAQRVSRQALQIA